MSKWKESTLGAISSIITGPFGSQLHKSDYVEFGTAVIMPQNIRDREIDFNGIAYVNDEDAKRLKRYRVEKNDLVYSRRGDVEKHAFITEKLAGALCGTGCLRVRFSTKEVRPDFISLFLNKPETKKWLTHNAVGSNMPNLNTEILSAIPIAYPKKQEQINISTTLSSIEQKIALNNRIITELEAMTKIIYDYWFVQFDFPNDDGKPYRQSGGKMEYNETLKREIPKGWEAATLSTFIGEEKGGDWGKENCEGNYTLQVVCIRGADFPGLLGRQSLNAPARFILTKNTSKQLLAGDIIVEISGGSPTQSTGRISYINTEVLSRFDLPIITSNFCKAFSLKDSKWLYWFYILWVKLYQAGVFYKYEGKTTGIKNLLFDILCTDYAVVMPQKEIIYSFNETVEPFFKTIQKKNTENLELTRLRDWLLPMLMNGQAMVADIEDPKVSIFPHETKGYYDKRFEMWLQNQGLAARGDIDRQTLREIFDAMDDDDK